jgi:hypothetical protein
VSGGGGVDAGGDGDLAGAGDGGGGGAGPTEGRGAGAEGDGALAGDGGDGGDGGRASSKRSGGSRARGGGGRGIDTMRPTCIAAENKVRITHPAAPLNGLRRLALFTRGNSWGSRPDAVRESEPAPVAALYCMGQSPA